MFQYNIDRYPPAPVAVAFNFPPLTAGPTINCLGSKRCKNGMDGATTAPPNKGLFYSQQ